MRALTVIFACLFFTSQALAQAIPFPGPGSRDFRLSVTSIGSSGTASGGTTLTMTTSAAIPAGATVVVAVIYAKSSSITVSSVSDGTNSYTQASTAAWSAGTFVAGDFWYCSPCAAVSSSATITATLSSSNIDPGYLAAAYVRNVKSSPVDKSSSFQQTGPGTAFSSGSTGTLTQANEVAFGVIGGYTSPAVSTSITEGSGFTTLVTLNNGASTRYFLNFAYQIVSATTALNYQPTTSANAFGISLITTFKGL